jgi:hypothetical protein
MFDVCEPGKKRSEKWEVEPSRYALKLDEKDTPHCLIGSGMAAFSFRAWLALRL